MKYWFNVLAIAALMAGCAEMPGSKPDPVPPKLVVGSDNVTTWDRPSAFGPVPAELQTRADQICKSIGAKKAIGYHAKAEDTKGKPIPGGGYYCTN